MNDRTGRTACSLEPGIRIPRPFWRGTKPGNSVAEKIPAKKWAIIKHARSGSNLFRQWNPGKTSQDKQGEEYVKLIRTVRNGMEALKKTETCSCPESHGVATGGRRRKGHCRHQKRSVLRRQPEQPD